MSKKRESQSEQKVSWGEIVGGVAATRAKESRIHQLNDRPNCRLLISFLRELTYPKEGKRTLSAKINLPVFDT